jgi:TRAP-type C4-dicarboxylate transport system permease large subunit
MPFVIYGVTTNTSISALFLSGIVPGLMMGAGLIVTWRFVLRKIDLPKGQPLPMRERLRATAKAFWALLMPVIIIGGMKSGVFTPTEAAVVAAFYALVMALFVHREMKLPEIYGVLVRAAKHHVHGDVPVRRRAGGQLHDHAGRSAQRADRLAGPADQATRAC